MGDTNSDHISSSKYLQFYNLCGHINVYLFLNVLSNSYIRSLELESNRKQKYISEIKKKYWTLTQFKNSLIIFIGSIIGVKI